MGAEEFGLSKNMSEYPNNFDTLTSFILENHGSIIIMHNLQNSHGNCLVAHLPSVSSAPLTSSTVGFPPEYMSETAKGTHRVFPQ